MRQYEDPPEEISHPAHPAHNLKLVSNAGAPFVCDGCKEPGDGARYTCDDCESPSFDLHPPCALADEDAALEHPLFRGSKFVLLPMPPAPVDGTICDACGEPASGFVYHCFDKDLDIHPCCARLPDRILQDGRVFELLRKTSRACGLCAHSGRRRKFWAYRSCFVGEDDVDLHVACMKDMACLSWEAAYQSRSGGGQIVQASLPNIERGLQSLPRNRRRRSGLDNFIRIVRTVASIIIAVIFGNPVAMIAAIAGPGGFLGSMARWLMRCLSKHRGGGHELEGPITGRAAVRRATTAHGMSSMGHPATGQAAAAPGLQLRRRRRVAVTAAAAALSRGCGGCFGVRLRRQPRRVATVTLSRGCDGAATWLRRPCLAATTATRRVDAAALSRQAA